MTPGPLCISQYGMKNLYSMVYEKKQNYPPGLLNHCGLLVKGHNVSSVMYKLKSLLACLFCSVWADKLYFTLSIQKEFYIVI